jgi:hypothetical protein
MSIDVLARAWKHSQQDGSSLLALLALGSMAHDDGVLWMRGVTVEYIGRKARTKVRQTQRILRSLQDAGEIYAPPAVGRGHTTRYFVTIGLSQEEITATLRLEFDLAAAEARAIAGQIMQRQKVYSSTPFTESTAALEEHEQTGKVSSSTPFLAFEAAPAQEEHGEKVSSSTPIQEKVSSMTRKGVIHDAENSDSSALERADRDPIRIDPNHNNNSNSARVFLRDARFADGSRFYNGTIPKILALQIDPDTLRASVEALSSAGWNAPEVYAELQANPPQKGVPYATPTPGGSSAPAGGGGQHHATAPVNRARSSRSAGSHNATGGADLRDPGWQEREIARINAIYGTEDL